MIQAGMLDAGMVILSGLSLGLARQGKPSRAERVLIQLCAAGSAAMNYLAADDASPRSVIVFTAAPVFAAIITDRVVSVVRGTPARRHESAWAWLGRAVPPGRRVAGLLALYWLRFVLAPRETATGVRRMVLDAAPVPGVTEVAAALGTGVPDEPGASQDDNHDDSEPAIEFATKKQAFLSRYRGHPQYGLREAAGRVAAELAPLAGLQAGTGRTYIAEEPGASTRPSPSAPLADTSSSPHRRGNSDEPVRRVPGVPSPSHSWCCSPGAPFSLKQQVRRMKWRTRLRIRPGDGFASHWEITFRFSRFAALHHGRRCRPDMRFTERLISPARAYAVRLGRAQAWLKIYARGEDQVAIIAPQRTNKTGILADRVYGHPGACVAATTRADMYLLTSGRRAQIGPVQVFNPEGIGGIASTFQVDIVADCLDPEVAIRTAAALAGPTEGSGDMQFWLEKAVFAMAALMHAAALLDEDMSAVWRWSQRLGDPLKDALNCPGASPELLDRRCRDPAGRPGSRLHPHDHGPVPGLGRRPGPAPDRVRERNPARRRSRVDQQQRARCNVLNSGELSAAAPLFRAVIEKVHRDCVFAGSLTPFGRIPSPVLFALDEVTQTAAVPLADWLATSAGSGIQVCFVVHTPAQLRVRYGPDAAKAIWALAGTKIVLGGNTDAEMAEEISKLAGMYGGEMALPVVPVAFIRQLPESRALVLAMNRSPIAVKVRPVWRRVSFRLRMNPAAYRPLPEPVPLPEITRQPESEAA